MIDVKANNCPACPVQLSVRPIEGAQIVPHSTELSQRIFSDPSRAAGPRSKRATQVSYFSQDQLALSVDVFRWDLRLLWVFSWFILRWLSRKKPTKKKHTTRQNVRTCGGRHSPVEFQAPGPDGCLRSPQQFSGNRCLWSTNRWSWTEPLHNLRSSHEGRCRSKYCLFFLLSKLAGNCSVVASLLACLASPLKSTRGRRPE